MQEAVSEERAIVEIATRAYLCSCLIGVCRLHVLGTDGIDQYSHAAAFICPWRYANRPAGLRQASTESMKKKLCIASMAWDAVSLSEWSTRRAVARWKYKPC